MTHLIPDELAQRIAEEALYLGAAEDRLATVLHRANRTAELLLCLAEESALNVLKLSAEDLRGPLETLAADLRVSLVLYHHVHGGSQ